MEDVDRSERLLALILLSQMKGAPLKEKALQLSLAGFSNVEIADIVQASSPVVAQMLYEARKDKKTSSKKKKARAEK